jgi:tRNA(Ile)-lysidine synthase
MDKFVRNLLTEWRKLQLPFTGATFVIAVSGGADSVSLAVALNDLKTRKKLDLRFIVAHFNHRLRGEDSDRDEQFVRDLAEKFNFELALGSGEISNQAGNLEQNAREGRYKFLTETAENLNARAVLTAHTLNDQAETFLFNLIRGSGLDGLGGMKPVRSLDFGIQSLEPNKESKIQLVRPLLNWAKREDTESFCLLNKIEFRYDAMNEDLKFNRVRIRRILLPMLKEFNPKIVETLAKTAHLLREDAEQLADRRQRTAKDSFSQKQDEIAEKKEVKNKSQIENLSFKDLKDVFPSMRRIIIRDWLKRNRGNLRRLQLSHIEAVERLIFSRKSGREIELPGGETVIKKAGKLVFQKMKVEK